MKSLIKSNISTDRTIFYQYSDDFYKIVYLKNSIEPGYEEINKKTKETKETKETNKTSQDELDRISQSRTKKEIKEIALCNAFTHFATLTVNSKFCDRFSLQACQDKLKYIIQERIRRKNKDFTYIFITEKHKDGAFHFHGLIKNLDNMYVNNNGFLSHKAFDEIGFNSFLEINEEGNNSYIKVCNYITKYITKDCVKNENNQVYMCSRGLKRPLKYNIENLNFDDWDFENDFCKIKNVDVSSLEFKDYKILTNMVDKHFLI